MRKLFILIGTVLALLTLGGCVAPKNPRVFWPALPQTPRLEYLGVYYSQYQFDKSNAEKAMESIIGQTDPQAFRFPSDVVADGKGLVYVSDPGHMNVRIFDFKTKDVHFLFKQHVGAPYGLALDGAGRLYVLIPETKNVLVFSPEHEALFHFGQEVLQKPAKMAVDNSLGRIYVTDLDKNTIEAFDLHGEHLMTIGGPGTAPGFLGGPSGITVDREGNIWVTELLNARIQAFTPEGKSFRHFGERSDLVSGFEMPKDLDFDSEGNLHVVDSRKGALLTYAPDGTLLLFTGTGRPTHKAIGFGGPGGIDVDANDQIYVADLLNKRFAVWQYLSEEYKKSHPITEEDKEVIRQALERQKREQAGRR